MEESINDIARKYRMDYTKYNPFQEIGAMDLEMAFKDGAKWFEKQHMWNMAADKLPEENVTVLAVYSYNKYGDVPWMERFYREDGKWHCANPNIEGRGVTVLCWMPIPSFEEILEANKDVLLRLKMK